MGETSTEMISMKKMPLVVLMVLISMVLISGLSDRDRHPVEPGPYEMPNPHSDYIDSELYGKALFYVSDEKVKPKDERGFLEDNIQKSDEIVPRLEASIEYLASEGNDVSEFEEMVTDYSSLVSEARSYLERADSAASISEEQRYVSLSKKRMIQSDILLKNIFVFMRSHMPGPLLIYEGDSLDASGEGAIIMSGDLDINLGLSSGDISVVDFKGDAVIDDGGLTGPEATRATLPMSTAKDPHLMISYMDVQGNVSIYGSGLTIAVMADSAILHATGIGEVQLHGYGSYYLENSSASTEGAWLSPIFETPMNTEP